MNPWQEFVLELQLTFSPHDPIGDAKNQHQEIDEN